MTSVIDLYEQLSSAPDDRARARVIAEAFEHMEQRYPEVTDLATGTSLRETELRLQKEIEQLRVETREMEGRIQKEIEQLRGDVRKEIEQLRAEMHQEIGEVQKEVGEIQKEVGEIQKEVLQMRSEMRQMDHRLQKEIAQTKGEIIKWTVTWTGGLLMTHAALLWAGLHYLLRG